MACRHDSDSGGEDEKWEDAAAGAPAPVNPRRGKPLPQADARLVAYERAIAELRAILAELTVQAGGHLTVTTEHTAERGGTLRIVPTDDGFDLSVTAPEGTDDTEVETGLVEDSAGDPHWPPRQPDGQVERREATRPGSGGSRRKEEEARSAAIRAALDRRIAELLAKHGGGQSDESPDGQPGPPDS